MGALPHGHAPAVRRGCPCLLNLGNPVLSLETLSSQEGPPSQHFHQHESHVDCAQCTLLLHCPGKLLPGGEAPRRAGRSGREPARSPDLQAA